MATITLFIKNKTAKQSSVSAVLRDGSTRIVLSSGVKIPPKHWNTKKHHIFGVNPNAQELNAQLKVFKDNAFNIYNEAKNKGIQATGEYIREKLKPKEIATTTDKAFWGIFDNYLSIKERKLSISSIKKIKSLKVHLEGFEKKRKVIFDINEIDHVLLESLQEYLYQDAKLNKQTTAKYLGLFKTFLNWCKERKLTTNEDHKLFKLTHQPDTLKPVLIDLDLNKIRSTVLEHEYLQNARQLLLLSTLTGLRYSDYSKINESHIRVSNDGSKYLTIRQTKTNEAIEVPLTLEAEKIIQELLEGKIHSITNQSLNKYVKEVCKLAGIDELFEVHEFKGNFTTSKKVPKYELITTHTGRRTFATNLLLKGVPTNVVMEFTGHKDERSFAKYVNIPKEKTMEMVRKALMN
ncbi:hypothetical protein EI427_05610 [Flammeovirga pectinis]|uniref:Tyr recombinase domain-containing protein n=1 Tax=Flammeovirga pectinis TaxID=2494373 RepID=A0A3Q9FPJ9_9BACT|nr:tyrosine-type recombinase/integrase [Flammeovirga pectinis]AZQ61728.1 hypothetical protein EI427_05610 [Flammeovirga pectinis]